MIFNEGDPRPSTAWAGDEARTGLPAYALVELGFRLALGHRMTASSHKRTPRRTARNDRSLL